MPGLYYFLVFYIYSRMRLTSFLQAVAFYVLQLEDVRFLYGGHKMQAEKNESPTT